MSRDTPETDPDEPEVPAAPADAPPGSVPPVRAQPGTSETAPPAEGVRQPDPDDPA